MSHAVFRNAQPQPVLGVPSLYRHEAPPSCCPVSGHHLFFFICKPSSSDSRFDVCRFKSCTLLATTRAVDGHSQTLVNIKAQYSGLGHGGSKTNRPHWSPRGWDPHPPGRSCSDGRKNTYDNLRPSAYCPQSRLAWSDPASSMCMDLPLACS